MRPFDLSGELRRGLCEGPRPGGGTVPEGERQEEVESALLPAQGLWHLLYT